MSYETVTKAYLRKVTKSSPLKPNISNDQLNKLFNTIIREPYIVSQLKNKINGKDKYLDMIIMKVIIDHQNIFWNDLFSDYGTDKSKYLSKVSNLRKTDVSTNFIYGEAILPTLYEILLIVKPPDNCVFYDLGSGTGRAVFAAHLLHNFKKCKGIELLDTLYQASINVLKKYETLVDAQTAKTVMFKHGDILKEDWSDGDIIFANSTCFDDNLMNGISKLAEKLKKGSCVISLTKHLKSDKFRIVDQRSDKYSWGVATTYIQLKVS